MPTDDLKSDKYKPLLEAMHERWRYTTDQLREIRAEARTDMRYVSGDPWKPNERLDREKAGRPCLSLDELAQYTNQLINGVRQHKRAIKVTPVGTGASDKTAQTREDLIRQIEYRSNAQQAYTVGFENTVNRSYGFWRVRNRYVQQPKKSGGDGSGMNQELVIQMIPNPDNVTPDPDAIDPTGRDMQFCWITEQWDWRAYRRKWPKAKLIDFTPEQAADMPQWMDSKKVQIAEYWTVETNRRNLLLFKGKTPGERDVEVFEDDWKDAKSNYKHLAIDDPDDEREVEDPIVRAYLTNGFEVLEPPKVWPGKTIPIVSCYGKVLYVDVGSGAKKQILSAIRLARDPFMLYCYYRTTEAELVGMLPKFPYFVRRGSLKSDQALLLQKSLHEPIAFIEVETRAEGVPPGDMPEMPARQPYDPAIQAMEIGAEGARRAIQAAMGISPLPTQALRMNEKSGKALQQIDDSEEQGTFHFVDAYEAAIARTGEICNEVLDVFYDTARDVTLRDGQGVPSQVRLNDPTHPDGLQELGPGYDHDVTLSTGPSFDSEREQANDFSDTMVQAIPSLLPIIGNAACAKLMSLAVKLKNLGPIGDEIAELLAPPDPGQMDPAQAMQQLQGLQQQVQQLTLEQQTESVKQRAMLEKADKDNIAKIEVEHAKNQTDLQKAWIMVSAQLLIAAAKVGAENARSLAEALDKKDAAALGATLEALGHTVKASEAGKDRAHDVGMALIQHAHATEQADQQQQHTLEQGDQSHGQALDQAAQQAALEPEQAAEPAEAGA